MRACVCVLTALPGAELTHECGPQAGTRPNDLNLDEMVDLKQMPREERISLMNARLLAKYKEMNVIETQTRDLGAKKKKTTLEEELEWEMEADASAWEEAVDSHFGGSAKLQMTIGEEKIAASRQARIKEQTQANLIHRRDVNTMEALRAEASDMTKASTARHQAQRKIKVATKKIQSVRHLMSSHRDDSNLNVDMTLHAEKQQSTLLNDFMDDVATPHKHRTSLDDLVPEHVRGVVKINLDQGGEAERYIPGCGRMVCRTDFGHAHTVLNQSPSARRVSTAPAKLHLAKWTSPFGVGGDSCDMLQVDAASCCSPQAGVDPSMSLGGGEGRAGRHGAAAQLHSQTPEMVLMHGAQSYPHTPQMMFLSPAQRPHTVGGNRDDIGKRLLFFNEGAQDVVDSPILTLNAALHPPHPARAAFLGGRGTAGETHVEDGEEEGVSGGEGDRGSKGGHLKLVFRQSFVRRNVLPNEARHDDDIRPGCVCLCVCSCVCVCVRACVRACGRACARAREREYSNLFDSRATHTRPTLHTRQTQPQTDALARTCKYARTYPHSRRTRASLVLKKANSIPPSKTGNRSKE